VTPSELRDRADRFGDDVSRFCRALPHDPFTRRVALQLHDAAQSTAANYHAACRAASRAAFLAKLSITVEEADESLHWLSHLDRIEIHRGPELTRLMKEANELVAIFVASRRTASDRRT
jgi:four helix bundle protein